MAFVINDRVKETTTTTGTGTLTLDGAVTGFETFSGALGNTNTTYYAIVSQNNSDFEVGIGTVGAGTLSRDTIISSSNSDAAVNFSAGTKDVFVTLPASKAIVLNDSGTVDITGNLTATGNLTSTGIDDNATSTAITIDSSENVGIGTTSPNRNLQVGDGSGSSEVIAIVTANTGSSQLALGDSDDDNRMQIIADHSVDKLGFQTGGGGGIDLSKMIIDSSGNVGIGETSPLAKLHVKIGDSGASANAGGDEVVVEDSAGAGISILSGNASRGQIIFGDDGDNNVGRLVYDHSDNALEFWTNGSERMRIDISGNVGIGTSSPSDILTLVGEGTSGNNQINHTQSADSSGFGPQYAMNKSRGSKASSTIVQSGDQTGSLVFSGYDGTNYRNTASIESRVDGTPGTDDMPGRLVFFTTSDGSNSPTERMRIDSSGNVGIGTSSPANELEVNGTVKATQFVGGGLNAFRNIIINGDMSIAQRGTSTASITSQGYYTLDRFLLVNVNLGTWTQSQSTDVPSGQGFAKSLKMECTTADASPASSDRLDIVTRFEGQNLQYLKKGTASAESVTLSFWVKSNKTGTYIAELFDNDNSRQISQAYTINSANTWEKKTLVYSGDTSGVLGNDNGNSFQISWWLGGGSAYTSGTLSTTWTSSTNANRAVGQVNLADSTSNDWYITGVQLEAGTTASDFEFLPVDVNLRRCQRYYEVIADGSEFSTAQVTNATAYTSTNAYAVYKYREVMRASPSLEVVTGTNFYRWRSAGTNYTFNTISFTNTTNSTGRIAVGFSGATPGYSGWITLNAAATGFIALDAEL